MNEKTEASQASPDTESVGQRVDPILEHLQVEDAEVDKALIRKRFIDIWEYENGNDLDEEEQYLTTVAAFIYNAHNVLDDANIRMDKARLAITAALAAWKQPQRDKLIEKEKASENPFKTFIENHQPEVDETHVWKHFLLEHKKADEKNWVYKMKKCWFAEFFIRFGRTDYIQTACAFDKIPFEARQDYVDLKLSNLFAQLGQICQFDYKPKKDK
ncbi:MAG: L-2-amino-thiazoline-4-carboxylic acid hydrolase [Nitrospinae bacterium]|nr:L-2-amino-thiazoline-4-carboxylic acid hydrolase [Nitrospinota bacterium]MBL7020137.1 L-2-amino-thiazoline-4-carboxylic acid hydrolase [Nitrospinaceae bacterium]